MKNLRGMDSEKAASSPELKAEKVNESSEMRVVKRFVLPVMTQLNTLNNSQGAENRPHRPYADFMANMHNRLASDETRSRKEAATWIEELTKTPVQSETCEVSKLVARPGAALPAGSTAEWASTG